MIQLIGLLLAGTHTIHEEAYVPTAAPSVDPTVLGHTTMPPTHSPSSAQPPERTRNVRRQASADGAPTDSFCVQVITSSGVSNCEGGGLAVIVNGNEVVSGMYTSGNSVLQQCFPAGSTFQIRNPGTDGWTGHVQISTDGGLNFQPGNCTVGCDNIGSTATIIVDGDANPCGTADSFCHNGATCTVSTVGQATGGWTQLGANIDGMRLHEQLGMSVSLSANGTIVAVGGFLLSEGRRGGCVQVFELVAGV